MAFVYFAGPRPVCFDHSQDWPDCHSWDWDRALPRQDDWGFANPISPFLWKLEKSLEKVKFSLYNSLSFFLTFALVTYFQTWSELWIETTISNFPMHFNFPAVNHRVRWLPKMVFPFIFNKLVSTKFNNRQWFLLVTMATYSAKFPSRNTFKFAMS